MDRQTTNTTRTDTLFPYTTLFRSKRTYWSLRPRAPPPIGRFRRIGRIIRRKTIAPGTRCSRGRPGCCPAARRLPITAGPMFSSFPSPAFTTPTTPPPHPPPPRPANTPPPPPTPPAPRPPHTTPHHHHPPPHPPPHP